MHLPDPLGIDARGTTTVDATGLGSLDLEAQIEAFVDYYRPKPKPKLTDVERHQHFKKMAIEVEASDRAAEFDKAFEKVTREKPRQNAG